MKMLSGDFNIYWYHEMLTPGCVRAARYGSSHDSGGLVPEVGDVIGSFHGLYGAPIAVRVTEVTQIGDGVVAFEVRVVSI